MIRLTEQQRRIVNLIDCGADTAAIGEELGIGRWTVRDKIVALRRLLGAKSMLELPGLARAAGVVLDDCVDEWVAASEDVDVAPVDLGYDDDGRVMVDDKPLAL